jgi:hypothetical protein
MNTKHKKHVNLTVKNATPFAITKVAPFLPAGYGGRYTPKSVKTTLF